MKVLRITCWLMIAVLLLNGSGVVSSVHKIMHHAGDEAAFSHCDHDGGHNEQPSDEEDQPQPEDEDCEICLGLAGLNLVPAEELPRVQSFGIASPECVPEPRAVLTRDPAGDHPARAPPAC